MGLDGLRQRRVTLSENPDSCEASPLLEQLEPRLLLDGTVTAEIYSCPTQVDPGELVDVRVRIKLSGDDNDGPWQVTDLDLRDDDDGNSSNNADWSNIYNNISQKDNPFEISSQDTWYYDWFYDIDLSAHDDGGNGVELFVWAEIDDNDWNGSNPDGSSTVHQVSVRDPDPTASRYSPEDSSKTLDYDTNYTFQARGQDAGGDIDYADWTLSGPENDSDHDYMGHESDIISSYSHRFDVAGDYALTCVFADESGDTASVSWSIHVNEPPKPDLVISRLILSESSGHVGQSISITSDTKNDGEVDTGWNKWCKVRYYIGRSSGELWQEIGWGWTPNLYEINGISVGEEEEDSISWAVDAGLDPGRYYITAVADADDDIDEPDGAENDSKSVIFDVSEPPKPDLRVISLVPSKTTVIPGDDIEIDAIVKNFDLGDAPKSQIGYWWGSTQGSREVFIGEGNIPNVGVLSYLQESPDSPTQAPLEPNFVIPDVAPGTYYLTAVADYTGSHVYKTVDESDEDNNELSIPITVESGVSMIDTISRWWAYASDVFAVDVDITAGSSGEYTLKVTFEGSGSGFDLVDDPYVPYVTIGNDSYAFERVFGIGTWWVATIPYLDADQYMLQIQYIQAPDAYMIEGVTFTLTGPHSEDRLETSFVSDRPSMSQGVLSELVFEDGLGNSFGVTDFGDLASAYAPNLYFNGSEDYVPISAEAFIQTANLVVDGQDVELSGSLGTVADANAYLDLEFSRTVPDNTPRVIYSSIVSDLWEEGTIAINYWFLYEYSNWKDHGGYNTHEGDWEGITVFLERDPAGPFFAPTRLACAQHERHWEGWSTTVPGLEPWMLDGGQTVPWEMAAGADGHPDVFVGLGGHASYYSAGETDWFTPGHQGNSHDTEYHWGNLQALPWDDFGLQVVGRAPELAGTSSSWGLFPGTWGQPSLYGWAEIGDNGPFGLVFGGDGLRWLDPWQWSSGFDQLEFTVQTDGLLGIQAHDFGYVLVGDSTSATVLITNESNEDVILTGASIHGLPFGILAALDPTDEQDDELLSPGESRAFTITYSPQSEGDHQGELRLYLETKPGRDYVRHDVELYGTAYVLTPDIDVELPGRPDGVHDYSFGNVEASSSDAETFTIRNQGDGDLTVQWASGLGQPFEIDPTNGSGPGDNWVIAPGGTQTFTVTFSPTDEDEFTDILTLHSDDPDEGSYQISLTGTGVIIDPGDDYEDDDLASRATAIPTDGTPQEHSIHVGSDVDWVSFTLAERSNITIETDGSSGDTRMWLYGPNNWSNEIEYDDDGGNDNFSRIVRTGGDALDPGIYYVKIDEYNNNDTIDSYTISVLATEPALPTVQIEASDADASEPGADTGAFTINIADGDDSWPLTINFAWPTVGTAVPLYGDDFTLTTDTPGASITNLDVTAGTASIVVNSSTASIIVVPVDDAVGEQVELLELTVTDGAGYAVGSSAGATVNIFDDDISLTGIAITGPTEATENGSANYTCTAFYDDGSDQDITNSVSWETDSQYATINHTGKLTASSVPSDQVCTITASYAGIDTTHQVTIVNDEDETPPTPAPSWQTVPYATGPTSIEMASIVVTDPSGVEYFFEETTGNPGGDDSGWQSDPVYQDGGLLPGTTYAYRIWTRDMSANLNEAGPSTELPATPDEEPDDLAPYPDPSTWETAPYATGHTSIRMVATTADDPSGVEYYFEETSGNPGGNDSEWQDNPVYEDLELSPGTTYTYLVKTRDRSANANETTPSAAMSAMTIPVIDAVDDHFTFDEDGGHQEIDFLADDTNAQNLTEWSQPAHGSLVHSPDETFTYQPDPDFNGEDSFTYTISADGVSDTATVHITVSPVNDLPTAQNLALNGPGGQSISMDLEGSDLETPFANLTFTVTSGPQHGSLEDIGHGLFRYVPDAGFAGIDTFSFTVTDTGDPAGSSGNVLASSPATVTIDVGPVIELAAGERYSFYDASGDLVIVSLSCKGRAWLSFDRSGNSDIGQIMLAETDLTSSLKIQTRGAGSSTTVGDIIVYGSLKNLLAQTTDLLGNMRVDGLLKRMTLRNVADSHLIEINASGGPISRRDKVTMQFGRLADTSIDTHGLPIQSLRAIEWLDTDDQIDVIRAPWIGTIMTTGRRANRRRGLEAIAGDLQAHFELSSTDSVALRRGKIAGRLGNGGTSYIAGDVGSLFLGDLDCKLVIDGDAKRLGLGCGLLYGPWVGGPNIPSLQVTGSAIVSCANCLSGTFELANGEWFVIESV